MSNGKLSGAQLELWLHLNADELTFIRDAGKVKIHMIYCSDHSGCQVETFGSNIREVVEAAIKQDYDAAHVVHAAHMVASEIEEDDN